MGWLILLGIVAGIVVLWALVCWVLLQGSGWVVNTQ